MSVWHRVVVPIMKRFRMKRVAILRVICPELFDGNSLCVVYVGGSQHFWATTPVDFVLKHVEISLLSKIAESGHLLP